MLELLLINSLLKKKYKKGIDRLVAEHIYNNEASGRIYRNTSLKPKWREREKDAFDLLHIEIHSKKIEIFVFNNFVKGEAYIQVNLPQEDLLSLTTTQSLLQKQGLFAPHINTGHIVQLQIPVQESKNLLSTGLRKDLEQTFSQKNVGTLIAFDIIFFVLNGYVPFSKPEVQVLHIAKQTSLTESEKVEKIQEIIAIIGAPRHILFRKVSEYTKSNNLELPLWLTEIFGQDEEFAKDPMFLEASYHSLVSVLSYEKVSKLSDQDLQMMAVKAVDTIYTYNLSDNFGVITGLISEIVKRNGGKMDTLQQLSNIRMNVESFILFCKVIESFQTHPTKRSSKNYFDSSDIH